MTRLFVRIYFGIALVLLLVGLSLTALVRYELQGKVRHRTEELVMPMVDRARHRLSELGDDPVDRWMAIEGLGHPRRFPTDLMSTDNLELSTSERERFDEGGLVFQIKDGERWILARLSDKEVMVIGPLRPPPGRPHLLPFDPALAMALLLTLVGATTYLLLRPLERRIRLLAQAAEDFGNGKWEARAQADDKDALGDLARTFNSMAERIVAMILNQKELLRAVSHELRTPLSRLIFATDEALENELPEDKNRHLRRIERNLGEMNELIHELLTWNRLENEDLTEQRQPVHLAPLFSEFEALAHDLRSEVDIHFDGGESRLQASPRYFKRALVNLVTNAVRHTEHAVWVHCHVSDGHWMISVDDDGPGIPPKDRERIFEPFVRLDTSRTARLGGTGLGLSIVQRIMMRHHGTVLVEDSPKGGARFTLMLPMTQPEAETEARQPAMAGDSVQ